MVAVVIFSLGSGFIYQARYLTQKSQINDLDLLILRTRNSRDSNIATAERFLIEFQECLDEKKMLSKKPNP